MKTLLIYTGGTIGMMENPENGSLIPLNFNELQNYIPELRKFANDLDVKAFDTPIDSSDVNVSTWQSIASIIEDNYDQYSGFVILHGTDTMAYTASALSFMLDGLSKPVILTGSQLPIGRLRTDGKENLITAIEIATARRNGEPVIQEVAVLFDSKLFRGNRTHKFSTENFDAFSSPNYDDLASIGIHILYNHQKLLRKEKNRLNVHSVFQTDVAILKIFPGMSKAYVQAVLNIPNLKGLILETYGSGNAPKEQWFINELQQAAQKEIVILNITQCSKGFVEQGLYQTSAALQQIGIIGGADMTTEAALTKLMFLLGKGLSGKALKEQLALPIAGELTTFSSLGN
jgi:L-asparaginase